MKNEQKRYSYDFWYNNEDPEFLKSWNSGDENYYVNYFYEDVVANLDLPKDGYIVVLGTYRCVSFDKLCKIFGPERCIGFDLHNPNNHPRVRIKDCTRLSEADDLPIAFCHNDLGGFWLTPVLKTIGQRWGAKNIVSGGYFLGNNNYNRAKVDVESIMVEAGMENTYLKDLDPKKYDLSRLPQDRLESYMLSRKK